MLSSPKNRPRISPGERAVSTETGFSLQSRLMPHRTSRLSCPARGPGGPGGLSWKWSPPLRGGRWREEGRSLPLGTRARPPQCSSPGSLEGVHGSPGAGRPSEPAAGQQDGHHCLQRSGRQSRFPTTSSPSVKQVLLSPSAPPKLGSPLAQLSRETHTHTPHHPCPTNTRQVLPSCERGTQAGPESWLQPLNLCRFLDRPCRRWEPQFLDCEAGVMSAPTPRRCSWAQRKRGARLAQGERGRLSPRSAVHERARRSLHELLPYLSPAWVKILFFSLFYN